MLEIYIPLAFQAGSFVTLYNLERITEGSQIIYHIKIEMLNLIYPDALVGYQFQKWMGI